jgi:hypothetical protein
MTVAEATVPDGAGGQGPEAKAGPAPPPPPPATPLALKAAGNAALASGDPAAALAHYDAALAALYASQGDTPSSPSSSPPLAAVLLANKSAAALAGGDAAAAHTAARSATAAAPAWSKAWLRLVRACAAAGDVAGAAAAARAGLAAAADAARAARARGAAANAATAAEASAALRSAMDAAAIAAAARGDYGGFDGAVLEVRPAAEGEEWLGLPAPAVAGEEEEEDGGGGGGGPARPALLPPPPGPAPEPATKTTLAPRSFRSIHAALAAAADGDTILLLPGTHNGLGASVEVTKRVLICGGGLAVGGRAPPHPTRSATLDARGNVPALRLGRACVVAGLVIEASGFREGVRVEPAGGRVADGGDSGRALPPTPAPLLADCVIRASGDDGVAVLAPPPGRARRPDAAAPADRPWVPTFLRCTVGPARRAGVRVRGAGAGAGVRLVGCTVTDCKGPGLVVQGGGCACLSGGTRVEACGAEGVVVTGAGALLDAQDTAVARCAGPALDVSAGGAAHIGAGVLLDSPDGGGLWAWGAGTTVEVAGGPSTRVSSVSTFALLVDGGAAVAFGPGGAAIAGGVGGDGLASHVTATHPAAVVHTPPPPDRAYVGPPPPAGCFVHTPDPLLA